MLFVDQPIGTGYSFVNNPNAYISNEDKMGMDMTQLLSDFLTKKHPEYKSNPLYLSGGMLLFFLYLYIYVYLYLSIN